MSGVVIVCGGRDFGRNSENASAERMLLRRELDHQRRRLQFDTVRHGDAHGANTLADEWAVERGLHVERFAPDWVKHGKAAGPIRNAEMLAAQPRPNVVIAFPGGRGTAHMVSIARKAGVQVHVVTVNGRAP